jgi:hypothetical protein
MRTAFLTLIFLLVLPPGVMAGKQRVTEQQITKFAKELDVAKLDSGLSSQRLDEWLRSGPAHLDSLKWEMSDCDLKPDASNPNYVAPLCAKVLFTRGNSRGWVIITVGTFRDGIQGVPHVDHIFVESDSGSVPDSNKLSDLPKLLEKVSLTRRQ